MMSTKKENERFVSVELARIIACLLVIGSHICLDIEVNNVYFFDRILLRTIFYNGIAIFWFITGFFVFNNNNYKKILKKNFYKLWLPATILGIVSCVAYNVFLVITKGNTLVIKDLIFDILFGIVKFRDFAPGSVHLWFIYIYCLFIIIFPLIKKFVEFIDQNNERQIVFILITLALFIFNAITNNQYLDFGKHYINGLLPATIEIIYGHLLYQNKDKLFVKNINVTILIIVQVLIWLLGAFIKFTLLNQGVDYMIDKWFSLLYIFGSINIIYICDKVSKKINKEKINDYILSFGSKSFWIYMLHPYVIKVVNKLGVCKFFESLLVKNNVIFGSSLYSIIMIIIILVITYIIIEVIEIAIRKIKYEKENS